MGIRYKEVRSLQAWLRRDRKRYRRESDPLMAKRKMIQRANDYTYCNPSPGKRADPEACEQWAQRWLANFNAVEAPQTGDDSDGNQ